MRGLKSIFPPAFAIVLGLSFGVARAGFIPVLASHTGNSFDYDLNFTTNAGATEQLEAGDFITIYDLGAAVSGPGTNPPGITVPANFTITTQLLGLNPSGGLVNPTDSSSLLNVTFTYTGPTLSLDTTFTSTITAPADYTDLKTTQYTSTDKIPAGKNTQIGPVLVPSQIVPEPGVIAAGAVAILAMRRRW